MNASRRVGLLFSVFFVLFFGAASHAQVSITTLAAPLPTQTFNNPPNAGMPTAGATTFTNNTTVPGWYHARTGSGTTIVADTGTSNAGNLYSYGAAANPDRALGSIGSANAAAGNFFWGVRLQNNTGATITSLDVSYTGEQWRKSGVVVAQVLTFSYLVGSPTVTGSLAEFQSAGVAVPAGDFSSPINTATGTALDGNAAANRTVITFSITGLSIPNGTEVMLRWSDPDHGGADHGLSIDDFNVTAQGAVVNNPIIPTCPSPVTTTAGTATTQAVSASDLDGTVTGATITSITPVDPTTITLIGFTPAGGVAGTANATLDVTAATPANNYNVTIQWTNNDGVPQTANCVVNVVVNAPPVIVFIHDVQGNGAATPIPGSSVTIEGVVIGDFQPIPNDNRLSGFFVQEENADFDADPNTSEGIFVFCSACPTNVAEGQKVQVTGTVSEFFNNTQITATTAGSVVITNAGNNLAQVTASTIDLPVVTPSVDTYYEPMENMLVNYVDTLTVSEYFEQARYGRIELYEGARPRQFAEANPPSVAGYAAHLDNLNRRRVYIDDDDNVENSVLNLPNGQQFVFVPQANGGLSIGTQGTDFFRGGDLVNGLTGILHYSFSGGSSPDEWRIRPTAATPAAFTVANPRPAAPPVVGGAIRAASVNVLNYFTTLNVRGADSAAELNRQRERVSIVLCSLNADVAALMEIENHPTNVTITDLLTDVNTRCGGAHPYTFVNTGGALGTDQIRVMLIYRTGVLSPVGAPLSDMNAIHNRPPTAQTFDVVDALNPAFGQRFTALANHSKSKGSCPGPGPDADQLDGQSCWAPTREAQANQILTFVNGTVIPAAGDPDVLLLGDFNANAQETATTNITSAGYTDLETAFLGANAYSYLFDGQVGHIDYAFSSASLTPQVTGTAPWHINADENPLFDYNDEIDDGAFESAFEEKPDGSALVPPRVLFQPASPFRASDHDPVLVGIFAISDLVIAKTDSPDPVASGTNLTYTVSVTNNGPDAAASASWSDNLTDTTFVSLSAVAGWSCTTPAVGATGAINCTNPSFGVGNAIFTLTTAVPQFTVNGTVLSNSVSVTSNSTEANPGDENDTETTTVANSADLSVTKSDSPDPVNAGNDITYTITLNNAGPSFAETVELTDTVPAGTTFVSLASPGGWSCTTPAVGGTGNISCTNAGAGLGDHVFTLIVNVPATTADGASISNSATVTSTTSDPNPGNEIGNSDTTVATSADLSVTKSDSPDPVDAGANLTYTITVNNAGPSNASTVELTDTVPANTTFVSLSNPGGWSCTTPAVGGTGNISCTIASLGLGDADFTLVVNVDPSTASGASISNSATVTSTTSDPNAGNETGSSETTVATSADLSVTKSDSPDPVNAGANLTYTITVNNAGPSNASTVTLTDVLPAEVTFFSLSSPAGWSCTTPGIFNSGTVSCSAATVGLGDHVFTLVVHVATATAAGTVINNSATVATNVTPDPNSGNETGSSATTVTTNANLVVTKSDSPDPVNAGGNLTYTIGLNNAGPSNAFSLNLSDTLPAGTTFVSLASPGSFTCTTPAVGATGTVSCTHVSSMVPGSSVTFTLVVKVDPTVAAGTVISNTATATTTTPDPTPGNESATATTTVATSADLSVTKSDSPDPVNAGANLTYTITVNNAGPSNALTVTLTDVLPAEVTFFSLSSPAGWSCSTPGIFNSGTVSCSAATVGVGNHVFTLVVHVATATASGTVINNSATVATNVTPDPNSGNETGSAATTVTTSANLAVTKTDSPDPVNAGGNLTYSIGLANNGPSNAFALNLSDTLPAGTTFVSLASPGSFNCTSPAVGATGTVSCTHVSSMVPGSSVVFTLVVKVDPSTAAGTVISNTAAATTTTPDPNTVNNSATATTTVATSADLSVTKVDTPDPVTAGTNLTYTITVNNAGPSTALTATLNDTLPANTTFVSLSTPAGWSCTTPAVGGTGAISCSAASVLPGNAVFTLVVNVDAGTADGTIITNTATAASPTDSNSANDSGTATTTVGTGSVDLSVTKTDSPDPVTPGNDITYTITVNNAGPSVATSASLSDTLPAGTTFVSLTTAAGWSCTTPAVGAGGTISCSNGAMNLGNGVFTLVVNVDPSVAAGTVLTNTATISSATTEANPGDESGVSTTTVGAGSADLQISKTDSPDPVAPGTNLTYQITITNNGPSNVATASFSDTLPAGTTFVSLSTTGSWSCTTPAVGAGGTVSCTNPSFGVTVDFFTIVVAVDPSVAAGTILTNTATVSSATADPNTGNESSTATTTVGAGSADLQISKTDSPDPVAPGTNLTYQITITNNGPSNATSASFSDTLPAGTTFVSLSTTGPWSCTTPAVGAGGTVSCTNPSFGVTVDFFTLVVAVDPSVAAGTVLSNTATVASATADPNTGNESSTATTTVGGGTVDLSVTKTDSPDPVTPGENITYTITVNNAGPSDATSVSLSDAVPAGTTFVSFTPAAGWSCTTPAVGGTGTISCNVATLGAGNAVFTLVVATDPSLGAGNITNTATVASATTESNPGNESSTATTAVGAGSADLLLSKTDSPDPVAPGSNLTYQITITNAGPSDATSASFSDTLPAGTTFVSLSTTGPWSCTTPAVGAGGTVSCTNASFGVTVDFFTIVVAVDPSVAPGTVLSNTATITSATADPNAGNESSTATTTVGAGSADLTLTKTDSPDPVLPGTNITYTITLANAGPSNAATVALSDTTPAGTTFVSFTPAAGWSCTTPAVGGTGAISCSNASMAIGNAVFTLIVNVDPSAVDGAVITNTATVTSATADPAPGGESATATTTVSVTSADLSVTKVDDADPVAAGANLTYTITVNNAGPDTATNVAMDDTLPAETTFVSVAAPAGWTCTTPAVGANGLVSCTNPGMVVGNAAFTLVVNVAGNTLPGTVISNTASVVSTAFDPNSGSEDDTETTNVISPATVTGTKTASGTFTPGSTLTYTIVLSNSGPSAQADNPGNELTDVLPPQLTLISATASSGTALATVGTNTVTWNGVIPAGSSVTITIQALIEADVPVGTFVTNQGTISSDADGDGINEASGVTDDPQAAGSGNSTGFPVGAGAASAGIPALDGFGLAALAALLAALGLTVMRRS